MYDCQTWWIYASQKSKVIYDPLFFLSLPSNKATQTIFVMTKVYIFAIAKHLFSSSYEKKNWKNYLPKKEKLNLKVYPLAFESFLCITWWIYASQKSMDIYDLFSLFLSPQRKPHKLFFVMIKVYIFAIAKHHSTAPN